MDPWPVLPQSVQYDLDPVPQPSLQTLHQEICELRARNEALNAFVRTVAHDLKGPLSTLVCLASVLREDYTKLSVEDQCWYVNDLERIARKMSHLVDELLLLAQVGETQVMVQPLNMPAIVAQALEQLASLIQDSGVEIISPTTWPAATGYKPWVEEVWVNYLSNAIKYGGQPPRVELGADLISCDAEDGRGAGKVRFWVRDNGPGIALQDQARLFKPFTRLDHIRAPGFGLGLSIVRHIVEKLGGQVAVASAPGQGSTFSFTLPRLLADPR